jgi:hypothetical protein
MPKERNLNPVAAQHKADKKQALKKSKANVQAQRNEKLARRNPDRLQRQIDDPKDQAILDQLEKDLRAVKKARDVLGEKAPVYKQRREGEQNGGEQRKRRRQDDDEDDQTDEDVRKIPMPRDTPPPIPRRNQPHQLPNKPAAAPAPAQTTYSSAPVLRNLTEESKRFVPVAVAQNIARQKGQGGRLLEPEEADKLEKAGYNDARHIADEMEKEAGFELMSRGEPGEQAVEKALRHVEMEEVEDEGI